MTESKKPNYEILPKKFGDKKIEIIHKDDEIWMTAETIGDGLEYKNPRKSIMNLYYAHKDEIDDFKGVIDSMTPGGIQETTVFSEQGIYLLIMFSNQPKAKGFRSWVANTTKQIRQKGYYIEKKEALDPFDLNLKQLDIMKDIIIAQKAQQQQMKLIESKVETVNTELKSFEHKYEVEKPIRTETVKKITDLVQECVLKSKLYHYFFYKKIWDHFGIRSTKGTTETIGQKIVEFIQTNPIFRTFLEKKE